MFQVIAACRFRTAGRTNRKSSKRPQPFRSRRLGLESLETRQLLSATPLKFYVVDDAAANVSYRYDAAGVSQGSSALVAANSAPRGTTSTIGVDKSWVIDANRNVYVYNAAGGLAGSWTAGSLANNASPEGIATDGTDIWIVDSKSDNVYRYAGAASRLSGSQNAASSFSLNASNTTPTDIVTDGYSLWVVNDASTDKVFKYSTTGSFVGSWTIDAANKAPTGIAIDPANVSDIWISDSGTDRVYKYTATVNRNSGSQTAVSSFALASADKNSQGIAVAGRAWAEAPFEVEWVRQFGTAADDIGRAGFADVAGNVYVSGKTNGSLTVSNPTGVATPYLAQFDTAGNMNWVEQSAPIASDNQEGVRVAADSLGNVFQMIGADSNASLRNFNSAGELQWSIPLPSGEAIFDVKADDAGHAYLSSYAGNSIYLRKIDGSTGDVVWQRTLDTGGVNNSSGVSLDGLGNVYVVGYTNGSLIGPNAGLYDAVVAKYNEAGDFLWARQFGTSGHDFAFSIAADNLGNVYASGGYYESDAAFNSGNQDIFVTKFDASGTQQWYRRLSTTGNDSGVGLQTDGLGNVYFMGASTAALAGAHLGGSDIIVGKYNAAGDLLWMQQMGTSADESGSGLTGDQSGNLYIGTKTKGAWAEPNAGGYDAVLIKLSPPSSGSLAARSSTAVVGVESIPPMAKSEAKKSVLPLSVAPQPSDSMLLALTAVMSTGTTTEAMDSALAARTDDPDAASAQRGLSQLPEFAFDAALSSLQ